MNRFCGARWPLRWCFFLFCFFVALVSQGWGVSTHFPHSSDMWIHVQTRLECKKKGSFGLALFIVLFVDINTNTAARSCREIRVCQRKKNSMKKCVRSSRFFFVVIWCSLNDCYHNFFFSILSPLLLFSLFFVQGKWCVRSGMASATVRRSRSVCHIAHSKDFCGHFPLEHFIFFHFTC